MFMMINTQTHTKENTMTYITYETESSLIYGTGETEEKSIENAWQNWTVDDESKSDMMDQVETTYATQRLVDAVEELGGDVTWATNADGDADLDNE